MGAVDLAQSQLAPTLKPAADPMVLNFFSDPGHGWLEAPVDLLRKLNIVGLISSFSYLSADRKTAYLEEDCDAAVLLGTLRGIGQEYKLKELAPAACSSFIRRLPRFAA